MKNCIVPLLPRLKKKQSISITQKISALFIALLLIFFCYPTLLSFKFYVSHTDGCSPLSSLSPTSPLSSVVSLRCCSSQLPFKQNIALCQIGISSQEAMPPHPCNFHVDYGTKGHFSHWWQRNHGCSSALHWEETKMFHS